MRIRLKQTTSFCTAKSTQTSLADLRCQAKRQKIAAQAQKSAAPEKLFKSKNSEAYAPQ
jgi:hypothetical protein